MTKRITSKQNNKFHVANDNDAPSSGTDEAKLIREIEELVQGPRRRERSKYHDPKYIDAYELRLRGPAQNRYGGHRTRKLRGFKGNTYGAAGPCRRCSPEERAKIEAKLRAEGTI